MRKTFSKLKQPLKTNFVIFSEQLWFRKRRTEPKISKGLTL